MRSRKAISLSWAIILSLAAHQLLAGPRVYQMLLGPKTQVSSSAATSLELTIIDPSSYPRPPDDKLLKMSAPKAPPNETPLRPIPDKIMPQENSPLPLPPDKPETIAPAPLDLKRKMVELDTPASAQPPEQANYLSDKDRRVEQETRALATVMEKTAEEKPRPAPEPAPETKKKSLSSQNTDELAQMKKDKRRLKSVSPSSVEKMPPTKEAQPTPAEKKSPAAAEDSAGTIAISGGNKEAKPPASKEQGGHNHVFHFSLDYLAADRIDGQVAAQERELARLGLWKSPKERQAADDGRARNEEIRKQVRGALENFIPEVRPGNQTALNTRAHPFAVYITQMHRSIHQLWGFGFLVELDAKADSNPLNEMNLWTNIEIAIAPDGSVVRATIVHPSGLLPFDIAAVDTVYRASPYPATPQAIRSADQNVYLHWAFHRDSRQCGTFGVSPFILTKKSKPAP